MNGRDAARALRALEQVTALDEELKKMAEKEAARARRAYATIAHRLPLMVRRAGLSSALLCVGSRKSEHPGLLLTHLAAQLHEAKLLDTEGLPAPPERPALRAALFKTAREADLWQLERLTAEAERCLLWTKRLTVTVLGVSAAEADRLTDDGEPE